MFSVEDPKRDHVFVVDLPRREVDDWWVAVAGRRLRCLGPLPTERAARRAREQLFRRWDRHARALGGWAWRRTEREWVVTLPPGVPCEGLPLQHEACTQALW